MINVIIILGVLAITVLALRSILNTLINSENYYDDLKIESNAACTFDDYMFVAKYLAK